ncbi:MAG TPA: P-loop NTPase fold protein, partial [Anaerolineales bacterium]|nr:P-loop NTPase fold protein [Anaerolineales bacterium]
LNYARFADAFATLVRNPEAKTPITIGVYGQWGSGKSFLMKKIIEVLKGDQSTTPTTLTGKISETFKRLFSKQTTPQVDTIIIEFNAWVYSGSAHLWASLVTHLYREIERYFGVRAHYHRLIKAFRRFIPKSISVFLFYAIPALLIGILIGFENIQKTWDAANIALKAVGVSVIGGSLLATLPVLWSALREFADTLFMSRAMNLQQLAAKPDFRDQIGIMADIKSEIGFIGHLLETRNKRQQTRVILFIDDLDRCEHRKAVEVLQAIMLLLADRDGSPFVIFLGIDARVIVRAVEEHYGNVLVKAGINGYEYLDKIVQLPFVIPAANRKDIGNYIESLIWTKAEKDLVESKFAPKPEATPPDQPTELSKESPVIEDKK